MQILRLRLLECSRIRELRFARLLIVVVRVCSSSADMHLWIYLSELQKACHDGDATIARRVSKTMDARHVKQVINSLLDGQISLLHK